MGLPLIATNVPGCKNVVEDGYNGYLCNLKDGDDLADKMEKMYNLSNGDLIAMGQNSRKKVEFQFDVKHVIQKYHASIEALSVQ
jgi:glycosyltransferase involved in cell wall biosynthesis